MANLLERVQNVFDNHQDFDRAKARQEGYQQALYESRDAVLSSAVMIKDDWSQELARSRSESYASVHAKYEARIQGLNDAFSVLRQSEPGITTQLNSDEFRESATRQAHSRNYEARELGHSPYHLAYTATRQQLDTDFTQRETDRAKQQFIEEVTATAHRHLGTRYPSDDREAGIRQATVDWAHRHNEELLSARGTQRPILHPDEYQAGYDARREALDRKLDSWHASAGAAASKDTERQMIHDMAVEASRSVRGNWGDRGRGPERLNDPDYDRGQRVAIRDWSHEHNHRLAPEQHRIRTEERTREVHEYGLSY
jgi:hypothetical protein